ncbi:unnamed protein product [Sphagnum troendelagicum]|uniref:Uncharacterized protein n=1 Tax=Sphagnum troendelagicum TaxID=128251 RepID=A0ABP0UXP8_9BRYO
MITAVPGMKRDPQSLQHSYLKLPHADWIIPGHLVEMDQLQVGGELSTLVVELGVDTCEDISISLKARRPQRQRHLLISSFVHLGNMKDTRCWDKDSVDLLSIPFLLKGNNVEHSIVKAAKDQCRWMMRTDISAAIADGQEEVNSEASTTARFFLKSQSKQLESSVMFGSFRHLPVTEFRLVASI